MKTKLLIFPGLSYRLRGQVPVLAAALVILGGAAQTQAQQEQFWVGGDGNWSDSSWSPPNDDVSTRDQAWIADNLPTFDVTGGGTVTVGEGGESVGFIGFDVDGYTITGGALTMTNSAGNINASATAAHVSTINSVLAGTTGLTKLRNGNLSLGGNNIYTGSTTITAGSLRAVDGVGLPSGSHLRFNGGSFQSSGTFTRANTTTAGTGTFSYLSGKNVHFSAHGGKLTITIGGDPDITQTINGVNAPSNNTFRNLNFLGGSAANAEVEFQNNLSMNGTTKVIEVAGGDGSGNFFATISGVISNGGLQRHGAGGKLVLTGENTYSAGTVLNVAGTITVLGNKSALGTGAILASGGGILQAGADLSGANKISNAVNCTNNGLIFSGTNNLEIGGDVTNSGGNRLITSSITGGGLLTLSGTVKLQEDLATVGRTLTMAGTGNTTISGQIVNGGTAGNSGITFNNAGTTTLTNDNTYTGTTAVSAGTVLINGDNSEATGAVSVNNAATLGGSGTIGGDVTVTGNANLAPGSSVATLTIGGNLTISAMAAGDGKLFYDLGPIAASDKLAVTGTLDIGTDALGLTDFDFTNIGGLAEGVYTLITSGDIITGSLNGDDLLGDIDGAEITLGTSGDGKNIILTVGAGGGGTPYDTWAGGAAFGDDTNGDGVDNGLAWILGATSKDANALAWLPEPANDGSFLTLDFDRVNPSAPARLFVQFSNDLANWTELEIPTSSNADIGGGVEVVVTGPGAPTPDTVTVKIPTSHESASGALFSRLRVQDN